MKTILSIILLLLLIGGCVGTTENIDVITKKRPQNIQHRAKSIKTPAVKENPSRRREDINHARP